MRDMAPYWQHVKQRTKTATMLGLHGLKLTILLSAVKNQHYNQKNLL